MGVAIPTADPLHWFHRTTGVPWVLVHGFTGSARSWDAVAAQLGTQRPVVALHLPGHHPALPVAPSFAANVACVAALLDVAGIRTLHLVGYSLGARMGLGLLAKLGARIHSTTLIGVNPGLRSAAERTARRRRDRTWVRLLRDADVATFVAAWEAQPLFASQRRLPAEALARQRAIRLSHDAEALARCLETMGLAAMPDAWPVLVRSRSPVHVIAGDADAKFVQLGEQITAEAPDVRRSIIAGSGHNVPLEQPAQLAARLRESLSG